MMLRLIGKVIAGAAATAAATYLGNKFLEWAGILKKKPPKARKKAEKGDDISNV